MPESHKKVLLTHLDWNLQRLDEALKQESTDYFKSAALQRFGHTYTMAVKCIKGFGELEESAANEEQCFELAIESGWTENLLQWRQMVEDYQSINKKPQQDTEAIYQKLPGYQKAITNLYSQLQNLL
ncbi:MAG: hypothetical protein F3741_02360 [Nitrospinae bacterium]|nr:hypothetical protein [Nitrospinota bacterium]MZH40339.1 hypothetical protein [Nitrospinota bacterium]